MLTSGAVIALVGASAVGYAKGSEMVKSAAPTAYTAAALTAAPADESMAVQARELSAKHQQSVAADRAATFAAQQRQAAAAALAAQRQADNERAAREAERVAIIANAVNDPRSAAQGMLADYGWSDSQFSCLNSLWTKESGWRYSAENAGSGAYGIPQSLPASKMATVGADYRTNPITQITWGLRYIKSAYGTPCSAWGHSQSYNWY